MIKIISGFSIPVGPSIGFVNLCNQLNRRGIDCTFYGPDRWHLNKCKAADISSFHPEPGDIIIVHHVRLLSLADLFKVQDTIQQSRKKTSRNLFADILGRYIPRAAKPNGLKLILSCQDNALFPIRNLNRALFDGIHCSHASQVRYHKITRNHFVIPSFVNPLLPTAHKPEGVAGVLGSIRRENKTHVSIERALRDGCEKVILFGYLKDPLYYYAKIRPLTKTYGGRIQFAGFIDDRQEVYDSISDVYCAEYRPWSPIRQECEMTRTRFHGSHRDEEDEPMSHVRIFEMWKKELGLS